ncbi:17105_t:CDS:1, partial [Gigaspora margarita]
NKKKEIPKITNHQSDKALKKQSTNRIKYQSDKALKELSTKNEAPKKQSIEVNNKAQKDKKPKK